MLSQARTAAIAAFAGLLASIVANGTSAGNRRGEPVALRLVILFTLIACTLTAVQLKTGAVAPAIESFVLKRGGSSVEDAFLESRGLGAVEEFRNFVRRPLTGNGFGVYPSGDFPEGVVTIAGIPISAPVEKGFLPTAVLEETGLFGGIAFVYLVLSLAIPAWKGGSLPLLAAFVACLFVNVGEENLLSPSGIGYYLWMLIGLAARNGRTATAAALPQPLPRQDRISDVPRHFPNLMR
jgi:hypothetical protein